MTTQTYNNPQTISGMVQAMRVIRDAVSNEIKDMTFEEERAFLDKLLSDRKNTTNNDRIEDAFDGTNKLG